MLRIQVHPIARNWFVGCVPRYVLLLHTYVRNPLYANQTRTYPIPSVNNLPKCLCIGSYCIVFHECFVICFASAHRERCRSRARTWPWIVTTLTSPPSWSNRKRSVTTWGSYLLIAASPAIII